MAVSVHLVTRTRAEVDDAQIEVVARLGRESSVCRVTGPPVNKGAFLRLSGMNKTKQSEDCVTAYKRAGYAVVGSPVKVGVDA